MDSHPVPQPGFQPGFLPYAFPVNGGRPEPGDPLHMTKADGPELKLINTQLTGQDNYNAWARDLRRALVTKDNDSFLDGTVPYPTDERLQRFWKKCNQLVRTWIGNCLAPDVAARLPPTEDLKTFWANIREMYGRLNPAKIFTITQAISDHFDRRSWRWTRYLRSAGSTNWRSKRRASGKPRPSMAEPVKESPLLLSRPASDLEKWRAESMAVADLLGKRRAE